MDIVKRQQIVRAFRDLSPETLAGLVRQSRQHLPDRNPNLVDPLPFVVRSDEIDFLRSAAAQWGRLLTATYEDLWGPQNLLLEGILDHALVWGTMKLDPAYFRSLPRGVEPLSLFRLDLVRGPDGRWNLLRLETEVPRGLASTLETRIAHSRSFGARVPHDNLVRLAPFFQGLKDLWFQASLTHKDEPAIMVWTLGPSDPLYHEPVYLARYFGYPLVESRDLTVRSGKVFLKTLGGLRPVDVLVRMVSDRSLDPLAGSPGGVGGVAGLMQAVRDGAVLVTNAPGSGLLSHPALGPRWEAVGRRLLGEELLLPPSAAAIAGTEEFFEDDRWCWSSVGIRAFAARLGGAWELLPGGLVQKVPGSDFDPAEFQGTRKDLWVLSTEAEAPITLLPQGERPSEINRAADLPSRVADDLFWLGRYTERAWVDLRYLEKWWEHRFESAQESRSADTGVLDRLVRELGLLSEDEGETSAWKASRLADTIEAVHQIAGQLLDRLSLETHRILSEFGTFARSGDDQPLPETLRQLNLRLAAFAGLSMESMTRSPGWRFLDMGRRVERAQLVLEGVQAFFSLGWGDEHLPVLLDIFDTTLTYRTRYRLAPQRGPVLDLLLLDETNPRSLAFQLESLSRHVEQLPRPSSRPYRSVEERTILDLTTRLRLADGSSLVEGVLEPVLESLSAELETFTTALHQTYLAKIDAMESLQARAKDPA